MNAAHKKLSLEISKRDSKVNYGKLVYDKSKGNDGQLSQYKVLDKSFWHGDLKNILESRIGNYTYLQDYLKLKIK